MSKDPAFLFYSADFLVGVSDLTMAERGQYITLMCIQHAKGRLSLKNIEIAIGTVSDDVLAKFKQDENGLYYNERLEQEVLKRKAYSESRRKNGLKKWKNAYATENECICNELQEHMHMHMENENININKNNIDINDNLYFQQFNIFWDLYPKKRDKKEALAIFLSLKPSEELFKAIIEAVKLQKHSKQWCDNQYIPYPSTWLRGKRWEDEIPSSEQSESSFDANEFFEDAIKRSYRK